MVNPFESLSNLVNQKTVDGQTRQQSHLPPQAVLTSGLQSVHNVLELLLLE